MPVYTAGINVHDMIAAQRFEAGKKSTTSRHRGHRVTRRTADDFVTPRLLLQLTADRVRRPRPRAVTSRLLWRHAIFAIAIGIYVLFV